MPQLRRCHASINSQESHLSRKCFASRILTKKVLIGRTNTPFSHIEKYLKLRGGGSKNKRELLHSSSIWNFCENRISGWSTHVGSLAGGEHAFSQCRHELNSEEYSHRSAQICCANSVLYALSHLLCHLELHKFPRFKAYTRV